MPRYLYDTYTYCFDPQGVVQILETVEGQKNKGDFTWKFLLPKLQVTSWRKYYVNRILA